MKRQLFWWYACWTTRNGQQLWDGPHRSREAAVWASEQIIEFKPNGFFTRRPR